MKYLIVETHPGFCVALSEDGRYVKCANLRYSVGEKVEDVVELRAPDAGAGRRRALERDLLRLHRSEPQPARPRRTVYGLGLSAPRRGYDKAALTGAAADRVIYFVKVEDAVLRVKREMTLHLIPERLPRLVAGKPRHRRDAQQRRVHRHSEIQAAARRLRRIGDETKYIFQLFSGSRKKRSAACDGLRQSSRR